MTVDATTSGHKAALRLLGVLPVAGAVVTADAMFTHADVCQAIRVGGGMTWCIKDGRHRPVNPRTCDRDPTAGG